jgi:tRNA (guanine37-N1)-methyltransferase
MAVIDAVMRLIPGALGDAESALDESFGPSGGLEHPHYTRPREYRGMSVPEVLLNGDHAAIARWRTAQARGRTLSRRPDINTNTSDKTSGSHEHEPPATP